MEFKIIFFQDVVSASVIEICGTLEGRDCLCSHSSTLKIHAVIPKKKIGKFVEDNAMLSHPRERCSSLLS